MHARLVIVADRHFNLSPFRQIGRQVRDLAISQNCWRTIRARATLDNANMDTILIVGDGSEDVRFCHRKRCIGGNQIMRDALSRIIPD